MRCLVQVVQGVHGRNWSPMACLEVLALRVNSTDALLSHFPLKLGLCSPELLASRLHDRLHGALALLLGPLFQATKVFRKHRVAWA